MGFIRTGDDPTADLEIWESPDKGARRVNPYPTQREATTDKPVDSGRFPTIHCWLNPDVITGNACYVARGNDRTFSDIVNGVTGPEPTNRTHF